MKLQLRVDIDGLYFRGGAIVEIPELMQEHFQAVRSSDDTLLAALDGGIPAQSDEYRKVKEMRKGAAEILANQLTALILNEMSKRDTYNGY